MLIYYIDTCIWIDYAENRLNHIRKLGELALDFLNKIVERGDIVICSNIVVKELEFCYSEERINEIFAIIEKNNLMIRVSYTSEQIVEAISLANRGGLDFGDTLHAVIARDNKCILVTRDKDFNKLKDLLIILKPEDLL